ncbi:MAG: HEAT repeat domain-containing protein [Myxococcales bacterium]|nr:HEAT repeat domain-containing protein [Myxococcales bacterium]MDH3483826.1 HEAT repeat domain-containing protein [Myxococcales bacterium]
MSLSDELRRIFDADRAMRTAETALLRNRSSEELIALLENETEQALRMGDRDEATMRLERLADLCAQVPGPRMTDALIAILDDPEPRVRVAAGEALRDLGFERYAEVARGIERALEADAREPHEDVSRSGPAMCELPWVLAEIGEPSALPLIRRFLGHPDPNVAAAAIEALAQLQDPGAVTDLESLISDPREVTLEDFEDEEKTTIGELARDALGMLGLEPR